MKQWIDSQYPQLGEMKGFRETSLPAAPVESNDMLCVGFSDASYWAYSYPFCLQHFIPSVTQICVDHFKEDSCEALQHYWQISL